MIKIAVKGPDYPGGERTLVESNIRRIKVFPGQIHIYVGDLGNPDHRIMITESSFGEILPKMIEAIAEG